MALSIGNAVTTCAVHGHYIDTPETCVLDVARGQPLKDHGKADSASSTIMFTVVNLAWRGSRTRITLSVPARVLSAPGFNDVPVGNTNSHSGMRAGHFSP